MGELLKGGLRPGIDAGIRPGLLRHLPVRIGLGRLNLRLNDRHAIAQHDLRTRFRAGMPRPISAGDQGDDDDGGAGQRERSLPFGQLRRGLAKCMRQLVFLEAMTF